MRVQGMRDGEALTRVVDLEGPLRRQRALSAFAEAARANLLGPAGEAHRERLVGWGVAPERTELGLVSTVSEMARTLGRLGVAAAEAARLGLLNTALEGRLVVPCRNQRGRIVAFGLLEVNRGESEMIVAPGRSSNRLVAFGLDVAVRAGGGYAVLVEGIMDAVVIQGQGYLSVVGLGGGFESLSPHRLARLWRAGIEEVTLIPRPDERACLGVLRTLHHARRLAGPQALLGGSGGAERDLGSRRPRPAAGHHGHHRRTRQSHGRRTLLVRLRWRWRAGLGMRSRSGALTSRRVGRPVGAARFGDAGDVEVRSRQAMKPARSAPVADGFYPDRWRLTACWERSRAIPDSER